MDGWGIGREGLSITVVVQQEVSCRSWIAVGGGGAKREYMGDAKSNQFSRVVKIEWTFCPDESDPVVQIAWIYIPEINRIFVVFFWILHFQILMVLE